MAYKSEPQILKSFAVLVYAPFQRLLSTLRRFPYLETRKLSFDWMDICIQNVNFALRYQSQMIQLAKLIRTGGHQIDAGGLNRAVTQHVGQPGDVLTSLVERSGK